MTARPAKSKRRTSPARAGARLALAAAAAGLLATALLSQQPSGPPPPGSGGPPAAPSVPQDTTAPPRDPWPPPAGRALEYLERGHRQVSGLERLIPHLGEGRLASGALAAAALAAAGRDTAGDAARWTAAALDLCAGRWGKFECQHAQISLQRIALQFPQPLPPPLRARLSAQMAAAAPPPPPAAVRDPWDFAETENKRILQIARSLAAQTVADTPGSPVARGWGDYALAFLAAHERDGWYEAESPGYIASSMTSLLHLADHAPQPEVRAAASRQLDLLFAQWAQAQAGGFPAGPKSRTYVHWALGARNTVWQAWAWLGGGLRSPERVNFMDGPELPVAGYRIPEPVLDLLVERRRQPPYEIKARRRIDLDKRRDLDVALYSFATPDYILGAAQAVGGLRLAVSGGQEIVATLFPEPSPAGATARCDAFAPLYLWSRNANPRSDRWRSWAEQDLAVGHRNAVVARLGAAGSEGHAYLAPSWSPPEVRGEAAFSRCGDTYVALLSAGGGWDAAPAARRFPAYYGGDKAYRNAWVAVPRRQPARLALIAGRREEDGSFERFASRLAAARLEEAEGELRLAAGEDVPALRYRPGASATAAGRPIDAASYAPLEAPFLSRPREGRWRFAWKGARLFPEAP